MHALHQKMWFSSKNCGRWCARRCEGVPGREPPSIATAAARSLSMRALSMLRLTCRLCRVSGLRPSSRGEMTESVGALARLEEKEARAVGGEMARWATAARPASCCSRVAICR